MITAPNETFLNKTLEKVWDGLTFLNDHTDGGFFKLRQVSDTAKLKKASYYKYVNGQKVEDGWQSQIEGIVADSPRKVRGDRAEIVVFEEAGSNPNLRTSFVQGEALVNVGGNKLGILIAGGTGGDKGAALEGLKDMYQNPDTYDVLKYRHRYTQGEKEVLTGFFVPSYKALDVEGLVDNRGVCNIEKCKEHYLKERAKKVSSPKALIEYCAEYCFTAEEAFALEGQNKFNKVLIADQIAQIELHKICPKIDRGNFKAIMAGTKIKDISWISGETGTIQILEHPLWTLPSSDNEEKQQLNYSEMNGLYIAGIDGIDIGQGQTSEQTKDPSSFTMVVKRRVFGEREPLYVAIYKDRPDDVRTAFKQCIMLAMYYNCKINIEATRMSMVTWARDNGYLSFFMKRPRATMPDVLKGKSNSIGTPATPAIINHLTDLIANYVEDYCYTIWFIEMLYELQEYNDENKRKFDIIAAMGECELADEELNGIVPKVVEPEEDDREDVGWWIDERGYRHWGVIPKSKQWNASVNDLLMIANDFSQSKSSNPNLR